MSTDSPNWIYLLSDLRRAAEIVAEARNSGDGKVMNGDIDVLVEAAFDMLATADPEEPS